MQNGLKLRLSGTNEFETRVTVKTPVDSGEVEWSFKARFQILTDDLIKQGKVNIITDALLGVSDFEGIEIPDGVTPAELLALVRGRPDACPAILNRYRADVVKKNQGSSLLI
ncbi:MAG TPA: hypothetical protein VNR18_09695 [Hyphomicrobiales bacterium]|nr:hypothetical protein [Hyphomicrobiales bacterium]